MHPRHIDITQPNLCPTFDSVSPIAPRLIVSHDHTCGEESIFPDTTDNDDEAYGAPRPTSMQFWQIHWHFRAGRWTSAGGFQVAFKLLLRNWLGVLPVSFLKKRVKYAGSEKPSQ